MTTAPTAIVIPPQYAWTLAKAAVAESKHKFLRVGGAHVTLRLLTGGKRTWASADPAVNSEIFIIPLRITGTLDSVVEALRLNMIPEDKIQEYLNVAITKDNFQTTMKEEFNAEIAAYENSSDKVAGPEIVWDNVLWYYSQLKAKNFQSLTKEGAVKGVAAGGHGGSKLSLFERISKLEEGQIMDVSKMDLATGNGAVKIKTPKKPGKYFHPIVKIASNNLERYIRAIEIAYGTAGLQTYAAAIEHVGRSLSAGAAKPLSPKAPVVPGTAFAPPATLVPKLASPKVAGKVPVFGAGAGNFIPMPSARK